MDLLLFEIEGWQLIAAAYSFHAGGARKVHEDGSAGHELGHEATNLPRRVDIRGRQAGPTGLT
jgi:hypothetical protein